MVDKCEWKGGKFKSCEHRGQYVNIKTSCLIAHSLKPVSVSNVFCPFCGADIRNPEPEVIIKKSGETWVARYDGVDYLCLVPDMYPNKPVWKMIDLSDLNSDLWKPISEIEITDDIAKLRPMVVSCEDNYKLFAVDEENESAWINNDPDDNADVFFVSDIRLATVSDLEK